MLLTNVSTLDALLEGYAAVLGPDFTAYRNHTYRVMNFCAVLARRDAETTLEKIAIAAGFHDIGIWTDHTLDYLPPSQRLAQRYLVQTGRAHWAPEIGAMIHEHHKITRYRTNPNWLVEAFRQADLVDVSRGTISFGLPRKFLREALSAFPNAAFHKRLLQLFLQRFLRHPLHPLPMYRL